MSTSNNPPCNGEDLRITSGGKLHPFWPSKDSPNSHLLVLTTSKGWVLADGILDESYVKDIANFMHLVRERVAPKPPVIVAKSKRYNLIALGYNDHRFGSILFALQTNKQTGGPRFMAFAMGFNPTGLDYGLGTCPYMLSAERVLDDFATEVSTANIASNDVGYFYE